MAAIDSIYEHTYARGEDIKGTGYSYNGSIMRKTTSNYMFRNATVSSFLGYLDRIFFEYIEAVKRIRVFYNFTVDKNYRKIQ